MTAHPRSFRVALARLPAWVWVLPNVAAPLCVALTDAFPHQHAASDAFGTGGAVAVLLAALVPVISEWAGDAPDRRARLLRTAWIADGVALLLAWMLPNYSDGLGPFVLTWSLPGAALLYTGWVAALAGVARVLRRAAAAPR